ncbi:helix-turn-helix domain-containing protein [Conexibacter stalactiti]|uniref:helix-turn-helix domain-containing protein n=1 Tax=Conexibacter stalactiti TaxID=1940611 RepID=UPI00384F08EA
MDRRATALQMSRRGASRREIGERLGVAPSTVRGWLTDPAGSRARRRRAGYGSHCECCGTRTSGNRPRAARRHCRRCAGGRSRKWDRQLIVERMLEWRRRYGRWPNSSDWHATRARERSGTAWARWSGDRWPPASTVTRTFGRFSIGVDAAVLWLEDRRHQK